LTPIWLLGLTALAAALALTFTAWLWVTADSTTVIVIRDAEKAQGGGVDPPLSRTGEERAALLARMFGDAQLPGHIDAIYVTPALHNRQTATPLAAQLGVIPTVAPADDPRGLARRVLREHSGTRILVVGHLDTVPGIVAELSGAENIPPIGTDEYGTMYVVTVPRIGHSNLLRLHY
jgi:broad specificity phosphatase PhoE